MLKIRLQRVGRRNDPSFRVVVTDSRNAAKSGKVLEILGNYNPKLDAKKLDSKRIKHWIGTGAKVSDTMHNLLVDEKIIEGTKVNVLPHKAPLKKEGEEEQKVEGTATEKESETGEKETVAETEEEKPEQKETGEEPEAPAEKKAEAQAEAPAESEEEAPTEEEKAAA